MRDSTSSAESQRLCSAKPSAIPPMTSKKKSLKISFALFDLSNMGIWITADMIWHVSAWSFWRFSVVLSTSLNTWNERITASSRQISKLCLREKPSQALADGAIWTWSWPSRLIFREEIHRKRQSVSETQRHVTGVASRQTSENQKCRLQFFKASLTKSRRQNPNWKLDYCSISKEKDPQVSICFTWLVTFSFEFSFVADGWLASQVCQVGDFKNMQLNSHVWQKLLMKKKGGEFTGPTSHFLSWAHWRRHWFDPESRENRVGKSPYITSYVG